MRLLLVTFVCLYLSFLASAVILPVDDFSTTVETLTITSLEQYPGASTSERAYSSSWFSRDVSLRAGGVDGVVVDTLLQDSKVETTFSGSVPDAGLALEYWFNPDPNTFSQQDNPNFLFATIDGTVGGTANALVVSITTTTEPVSGNINVAGGGVSYAMSFDIPAGTTGTGSITVYDFDADWTKLDGVGVGILATSDFTINSFGFDFIEPDCSTPPPNAAFTGAEVVTVEFGVTYTSIFDSRGCCYTPDFVAIILGLDPLMSNTFFYQIPAQNEAYSLTISSPSFLGYQQAHLWVFTAFGQPVNQLSNTASPTFSLTFDVNEEDLYVFFGADCSITNDIVLNFDFALPAQGIPLLLEEMQEDLTVIINTGFDDTQAQLDDLSDQINTLSDNVLAELASTADELETSLSVETNAIDGELLNLGTDLDNLQSALNDYINANFTTLATYLDSTFADVEDQLTAVSSQITNECGSSVDDIAGLLDYVTERWNEEKTEHILSKLASDCDLVPAHFQTPVSQGGELENIFALVSATQVAKKAIADSQKTSPTSSACRAGTAGAYCAFFYRFPQGNGANASYNSAIASYNNWFAQARYAKAFQSLSTAYNALFMGQN